jgi:single-stranded-DNA-specific exonuclease
LLAADQNTATQLAQQLDGLNLYRREIEQEMVEQANQILQQVLAEQDSISDKPNSLCLFQEDWHQGVVGLVASRIKEKLNRPTIAFACDGDSQLKGSARSVAGVHIRDVLAGINSQYPGLIIKFGGHAMAAGLSILRKDYQRFQQVLKLTIAAELGGEQLLDEIITDGSLSDDDFSLALAYEIKNIAPWGQAFPQPQFDGVFEIISQRVLADKHIKLTVQQEHSTQTVDAIYFFADQSLLSLVGSQRLSKVELVYRVEINVYRGIESLQLMIEQLVPL